MLKEVSGDILLSGAQTIAHGVAPNDDSDSLLPAFLYGGDRTPLLSPQRNIFWENKIAFSIVAPLIAIP